jgi:serine/threonine protein kinase
MQYLHSKRFVHRDLKPSNILVKPLNKSSGYMTIKLTNFGMVKPYNHSVISSLQTTN